MVVVRESPHSKISPNKNTTQWPPKSPFQALLSSPSGRKRWQDRQSRAEDRSPSPSPSKPLRSTRALEELADVDDDASDTEGEEEDEETLQLQLRAIEAKLKLKKLQAKQKLNGDGGSSGRASRQESARSSSPRKLNLSPTELYKQAVEVPMSPVRKAKDPIEQLSPARQRLGLPSVRKAEAVSLKRSSNGGQLSRSRSHQSLQSAVDEAKPKVSSFSARLANSKTESEEKEAKQRRIEKMRSSGFTHRAQGLSQQEVASVDNRKPSTATHSRKAAVKDSGALSRSVPARTPREKQPARPQAKPINPGAYGQDSGTGHAGDESDSELQIDSMDMDVDSGYDPFSKIHLSKRHIDHSVVARELEGKQVYTVPRLLKEVKGPDYEPPDCETDYIVFAVLASKSTPLDQAQSHKTAEKAKEDYDEPRNKFMVLHLCDLKWEIDCFLFGTAFNQFWKLTPGTLLAFLNPAILPPKGNQHTGRFSLKLGSSEDAVMEIGIARDLGYCSAIKKDGKQCSEWVNKRKTEVCEFHLNLQIEKARKGNMTVNTMFRGSGAPNDRIKSKVARDAEMRKKKIGGQHHREYGMIYTVPGGGGKSAASLLDAEDADALHNMTQEEASRKRLANAQRERDLAKKLGEMGSGVGAEYMRRKHTQTTSITTVTSDAPSRKINASEEARKELFAKPSASDLGLLGKKSTDVHMSPPKDRKKHFGLGAISMSNNSSGSKSSEPMGWGGARKAGLIQPSQNRLGSPERGQTRLAQSNLVRPRSQDSSLRSAGSSSPVKKRARYLLEEKGIREPGRDSLPGAAANLTEEDDDDLDIV